MKLKKYGKQQRYIISLRINKPVNYQEREVLGPFAARRLTRIYAEHTKDYSFSPKIIRRSCKNELDYVQKRHLSLLESGLFEDLNDLLLQEINDVKNVTLEESPERTGEPQGIL